LTQRAVGRGSQRVGEQLGQTKEGPGLHKDSRGEALKVFNTLRGGGREGGGGAIDVASANLKKTVLKSER